MIDPLDSLAFSIQSNPGVYALLLGSGVSRAAEIPTGWEITLDLIRKLAVASNQSADPNPECWYRERYEEDPDYSRLLDELAKTQAERQQLLRSYFETDDEELEEGAKQPTAAHAAIARLVAQGFIKVIITTNFDCLVEKALENAGVMPTVLSSPDQVQGMLPLIHNRSCVVVKVHGDYRDTRILNTSTELSKYPKEFDVLLDRVFDEFGLIVCGWSADWDVALRRAMSRAPSRRFTTYWAVLDTANGEAQRLINHRKAQVVHIEGADSFFSKVQERVQSLAEFSRPHPLSTEAAVVSLKRYLPEPRHQIRLDDLVGDVLDQVVEVLSSPAFDVQDTPATPVPTIETAMARVRAYEEACITLLAMAPIGSYWVEEYHFSTWIRALQRLSDMPLTGGYTLWIHLRMYPGALLLYALGLGAISSGRLQFLGRMFSTEVHQQNGEAQSVVQLLPLVFLTALRHREILEGIERSRTPLNDRVRSVLRKHTIRIIPNDDRYNLAFDKLEILIALGYASRDTERPKNQYWAPLGAFTYRHDDRRSIIQEIKDSISSSGNESPFVRHSIFGDTAETCMQEIADLEEFVQSGRRYSGWL